MGSHSKLIREARNLAAARGHKLGDFLLTRISEAGHKTRGPA